MVVSSACCIHLLKGLTRVASNQTFFICSIFKQEGVLRSTFQDLVVVLVVVLVVLVVVLVAFFLVVAVVACHYFYY